MPRHFELEVTLLHIEPRIWRRILLPAGADFWTLHDAIQAAMGWDNGHPFAFHTPGRSRKTIFALHADPWDDPTAIHDPPPALADYFGTGRGSKRKCLYVYDFGDDWQHEVKLCRTLELDEPFERRLLDGARACPLNDCGGESGYWRMVEFVKTGKDRFGQEDHLAEWCDGWAPEAFDLDEARAAFDL